MRSGSKRCRSPDVAEQGVIGKTIPEAGDDIVEFAGPAIALVMVQMFVEAEIQGRVRIGGGNDVPAGPAAADVVERGETRAM